MSWSDDNNNKAWRRWLQNRFEDFEPEVDNSLEKKILGSVPSRRPLWLHYGIAVSVLVFLLAFIVRRITTSPSDELITGSLGQSSKVLDKEKAGASGRRPALSTSPARRILPRVARNGRKDDVPLPRLTQKRKVVVGTDFDEQKTEPQTQRPLEKVKLTNAGDTSGMNERRYFGETELLAMREPVREHKLKVYIDVQADALQTVPAAPTDNRLRWIVSVTPLQTFQMLTLRSTPELGYQNVRFAPVGSIRSKGIKLAVGLEKAGFGLTANYAFLRNWTSYEVATGQFEVQPSIVSNYQVVRRGLEAVADDRLHLVGLGLSKRFGPYRMFDGIQELTLGGDLARVVSKKQNMLSVYGKMARRVNVGRSIHLSVGPYVEIGISQRAIIPDIWEYRPYQAGISFEFIR